MSDGLREMFRAGFLAGADWNRSTVSPWTVEALGTAADAEYTRLEREMADRKDASAPTGRRCLYCGRDIWADEGWSAEMHWGVSRAFHDDCAAKHGGSRE